MILAGQISECRGSRMCAYLSWARRLSFWRVLECFVQRTQPRASNGLFHKMDQTVNRYACRDVSVMISGTLPASISSSFDKIVFSSHPSMKCTADREA